MPFIVGEGRKEHQAMARWLRERADVYEDSEPKRHLLQRASDLLMEGFFLPPVDSFVPMAVRIGIAEELKALVEAGWFERGPDTEAMAEAIREMTDTTFGSDVANPYE